MQFSPLHCYIVPLRPKYPPQNKQRPAYRNLFGNRGICLATGEFVWQQGNLFGNRGIYLATGEFVWQQGNLFGNRGICLATGEFVWQQGNLFGNRGIYQTCCITSILHSTKFICFIVLSFSIKLALMSFKNKALKCETFTLQNMSLAQPSPLNTRPLRLRSLFSQLRRSWPLAEFDSTLTAVHKHTLLNYLLTYLLTYLLIY